MPKTTEALNAIPDVEINQNGVFKYVLLSIIDIQDGGYKTIIRGYDREYHADIDDEVQYKLLKRRPKHFSIICLGGGFMEHKYAEKSIEIFGQATAIGKADHDVTQELLKKALPDYHIIISDRE